MRVDTQGGPASEPIGESRHRDPPHNNMWPLSAQCSALSAPERSTSVRSLPYASAPRRLRSVRLRLLQAYQVE